MRERLRASTKAWLAAIAALSLVVALLLAWAMTALVSQAPNDGGMPNAEPGPETPPETTPAAQPPRLEQFTLDHGPLTTGGETTGGVLTVVTVAGGDADAAVDVEIKPAAEAFNGAGLRSWPLGNDREATGSHELAPGPFHWRARTRDGERGAEWVVFDPQVATHFIVVAPPVKPPPAPGLGGAPGGISGGGGGGGEARPHPSFVDDRATIWDLLRPVALLFAGLGAAALAGLVLAWMNRRPRSRGPAP